MQQGFDRRDFILGLGAFGLMPSVSAGASEVPAGAPDLTLGIVSDVHIGALPGDDGRKNYTVQRWRKVLTCFRDRGVDGVLVAGDLTVRGLVCELELFAKVWYEVFPDGRLPDGRPVANLIHYGDHDAEVRFWRNCRQEAEAAAAKAGLPPPESLAIGENRATQWERLFHEPWRPVQTKRVKGYDFVLAHFVRETPGANPDLAAALAALKPDSERPFFFSQHRPFAGTRHALWGSDAGKNEKMLAAYPNAVCFMGHTHYTLVDDRIVRQKGLTTVNTGAIQTQEPANRRENGVTVSWIPNDPFHDAQMPCVRTNLASGGLVMRVWGDRIALERRDFRSGLALGDDLVFAVDVAARRAGVDTDGARAAATGVPAFAADAKVEVSAPYAGKDRRKRPTEQIAVTFPVAPCGAGRVRAYDYRVRALTKDGTLLKEKFVFSETVTCPAACEKGPVRCVFATRELKGEKDVVYAVAPRNCWGKAGAEIHS